RVSLRNVVELNRQALDKLGASDELLNGFDYTFCQEVGGAINWLSHDGFIVSSARGPGRNLVILTGHQDPDDELVIIEQMILK
ncbi:MAG: RES family NAD+ phosphorylase, partial [Acidobacteria bacterium]|nr:RES family NAD+ phosphorylase [Acidobacteriota bacterium]